MAMANNPVYPMKDSFIVKLGVELGLTSLALALKAPWLAKGCIFDIFKELMERVIGYWADKGIFVIDLGVDAIKIAYSRKEYREAAVRAYGRAKARVYTEEEKRAIRKEFQDIIRKYGPLARHSKMREREQDGSKHRSLQGNSVH